MWALTAFRRYTWCGDGSSTHNRGVHNVVHASDLLPSITWWQKSRKCPGEGQKANVECGGLVYRPVQARRGIPRRAFTIINFNLTNWHFFNTWFTPPHRCGSVNQLCFSKWHKLFLERFFDIIILLRGRSRSSARLGRPSRGLTDWLGRCKLKCISYIF